MPAECTKCGSVVKLERIDIHLKICDEKATIDHGNGISICTDHGEESSSEYKMNEMVDLEKSIRLLQSELAKLKEHAREQRKLNRDTEEKLEKLNTEIMLERTEKAKLYSELSMQTFLNVKLRERLKEFKLSKIEKGETHELIPVDIQNDTIIEQDEK